MRMTDEHPDGDLPGIDPATRGGEQDTGFRPPHRRRPELERLYGADAGVPDDAPPVELPPPPAEDAPRRPLFSRRRAAEAEAEAAPAPLAPAAPAPAIEPEPADLDADEPPAPPPPVAGAPWPEPDQPEPEPVEDEREEASVLAPLPPRTPTPIEPDPEDSFRRAQVYANPVQRGREVANGPLRAVGEWLSDLFRPRGAKAEELLDRQLRAPRAVARTNLVVSLSPKGGVGKTTCTFLIGNLLASHPNLRTLVVDANPQWGTLASLAPDSVRSPLSLSDLLANLEDIDSATGLRPYVSPLATGCHLLAAPTDPQIMARIGPDDYTRLLRALARFYEVILLDLGTGVVDPLAEGLIGAADQALLVTTPEFVTTEKALGVVGYLGTQRDPGLGGEYSAAPPEQVLTVVLNKAPREGSGDRQQIEAAFRRQRIGKSVIVPHDDRLRVMLDSATYQLDELPRKTRLAIKRLGLAVAQDLV